MNTPNTPMALAALPRQAAKCREPYWTLSITPNYGTYRIVVTEHHLDKTTGAWMHYVSTAELQELPPLSELRDWIKTQTEEWFSKINSARTGLTSLTLEDLGL